MTTTAAFQNKPDFYPTKAACLEGARDKRQTNPRYKNFKQTHFTAGDEEQFQHYRDATNGDVCLQEIPLVDNLFVDQPFPEWGKYKDLHADAVINTFRYMFEKFKKGIFVKIVDNKLRVFLPFSKANYTNEWSDQIKVDKARYGSMNNFMKYIAETEGHRFHPRNINDNVDEWYGNNCLVRYEYPLSEGESNVGNVKNMLEELCASRRVPDMEFFINRRDFPVLTRDGSEPYNNIWGSSTLPLVSHNYPQYVPILSMSRTDRYADILVPTWEDWARIQSSHNKWFPRTCRDYTETFNTPWADKKPTAVFRGGTTGCGVTVNTNPRLKVAYLSATTPADENGVPYLDAGVSNWNLRPRKLQNEKYLQTIEIAKLPFGLASRLSPQEQASYKYIINIDGHVSAYRLSLELSMGSVILKVASSWKIWYSDLLVPYEHYVPVREDLSNLVAQVQWCREHDAECEQIAKNALTFYHKYLQKDGALDYLQKTLVDLKDETGVYLYNTESPLEWLIQQEYSALDFSYPSLEGIKNALPNTIPSMGRCYGLLQGMEWAVRHTILNEDFEAVAEEQGQIFQNKLGVIREFSLAGFSLAVKTTSDSQKAREHIHETYIGTHSINQLSKAVPNFAYIFGMYRKGDAFSVVTEKIHGETLHSYIGSTRFKFQEFLFIVMQLCLAIQVAQNMCGLVHYDLTPWNIMLQRLGKPMTFDYMLGHNNIIKIRTSVIPIIIDFGKSHVIHNGEHHGFINMFKVSTIQDVVTLLTTSINHIASSQRLPAKDFGNLLRLANFLSGTTYRRKTFENARELRTFFRKARKYSTLIAGNKYELENFAPYDLIKHIMKMRKDYKFQLGVVKTYNSHMNKGNGRQVFEYIFSHSVEERLKTYENVFVRLNHCTLPQPKNLFFIYYAIQSLETNLVSVRDNMMYYLKREGIDSASYENVFRNTMRMLHRVYQDKIDTMEEEDVVYDVSGDFATLVPAPYDESTFLNPETILGLIKAPGDDVDLSDYQEIIDTILLHKGTYQLKDKDRTHYLKNFKTLLETNALNMKNNTANHNTLKVLAQALYTKDLATLEAQLPKENQDCSSAEKYLHVYRDILQSPKF